MADQTDNPGPTIIGGESDGPAQPTFTIIGLAAEPTVFVLRPSRRMVAARAANILRAVAEEEAERLNCNRHNRMLGTVRSSYHDALADLADVVVAMVAEMER